VYAELYDAVFGVAWVTCLVVAVYVLVVLNAGFDAESNKIQITQHSLNGQIL